jgi:electron transfer flavoprotein beta subunit
MGADRGCLITDPCYAGSDTLATAYVLCKALRVEGGFDLVLCGRQAIDGDTAQVGPMLAELLGRPHLTCVDEILSVESEGLILHRIFSNCAERIFMPYGSLLTVTKGKIRPRAVNTMRLLKVRKSKNLIRTISQKELELDQSRVGLEGSLTRVIRSQYIRYDKTDRTVLSGTPAELSAQIRNIIQEHRQA